MVDGKTAAKRKINLVHRKSMLLLALIIQYSGI